jgi:DNA-binding IclR family transcriptional regulator
LRINKAASRTIDIIQFISSKNKALTLTEISKNLGIPKSSALEILNTLVSKNIIELGEEGTKTFKIGWKLLEMTAATLSRNDLHREARPHLEELSHQSGETVFLAVEDRGQMVYLDKVEGSSMIRATATLGSRVPMHCGALGKAFLAALPNFRIAEIAGKADLKQYTPNTITRYPQLLEEVRRIRRQGYAVDNQEYVPDIFCLGAPILNQLNQPIASISMAMRAYKMGKGKKSSCSSLVISTAMNLSRRLGFAGDKLYVKLL